MARSKITISPSSATSQSVNDRREALRRQVAEPSADGGMADVERYLAEHQEQANRLDEEHLMLGIGRTAAISMTHEIIWPWLSATASRWYQALPERYMTPDSMKRPDWNHSHYPHDENGHIGRVTTLQRPKTEQDSLAEELIASILADAGDAA